MQLQFTIASISHLLNKVCSCKTRLSRTRILPYIFPASLRSKESSNPQTESIVTWSQTIKFSAMFWSAFGKYRSQTLKRKSTDSNKSIVGEPTTTITAKAMNKSQTLLEINTAIASMLDSNWSYFSAPSYMKWFIADSIISMPLIRWPAVTPYTHVCL